MVHPLECLTARKIEREKRDWNWIIYQIVCQRLVLKNNVHVPALLYYGQMVLGQLFLVYQVLFPVYQAQILSHLQRKLLLSHDNKYWVE